MSHEGYETLQVEGAKERRRIIQIHTTLVLARIPAFTCKLLAQSIVAKGSCRPDGTVVVEQTNKGPPSHGTVQLCSDSAPADSRFLPDMSHV